MQIIVARNCGGALRKGWVASQTTQHLTTQALMTPPLSPPLEGEGS